MIYFKAIVKRVKVNIINKKIMMMLYNHLMKIKKI